MTGYDEPQVNGICDLTLQRQQRLSYKAEGKIDLPKALSLL